LSVIDAGLSELHVEYEIIVSDDGSRDGSAELVRTIAGFNKRIRLIGYPKNIGYGYALRYGFQHATKDFVLYTDSDLPCDISILKQKIPLLYKTDCLIGFRKRRCNLLRRIYSALYNFLIRAVFKVKVKDVNFSFKLFRREMLSGLALKSNGPFIDAEMITKTINKGYKIEEIEMDYLPRRYGKSRLSSPRTILFILYEMIKFYPEINKIKKET
jgi:glycosyltransferase involved in cell wall biosynthesis